ncbi:hypothetical protein MMC28_005289 [Mycoblastus sanguinarius]|nr:hypothetical protein [Mycoblastus sanguinarius]
MPTPANTALKSRSTSDGMFAQLNLTSYGQLGCQGPGIPINVIYGTSVPAQVASYGINRTLNYNEQLDFMTFANGQDNQGDPCAEFDFTASGGTGADLQPGCYAVTPHADCFRFWLHG